MAQSDAQALLLQVSADVSKLQKQFDKAVGIVDSGSKTMERRAKHAGEAIEGAFGKINVGEAFKKVFDSSRLSVLEEGGAKLRVFGSALEPLGGLGIAAAAGIVAFAFAMERAEKAVDALAEIGEQAKAIGVTTDFLQEFNHAAIATGTDIKAADAGLDQLNKNLGAIQNNLAKKSLLNAFKDAGFSKEQLNGFKNAGELIPQLADGIKNAGDAAQQANLVEKLTGSGALLQMFQQGSDGFNQLAKDAKDLGVVIDFGLIKKAEEAKIKLKELDELSTAKANAQFAEFAGTLLAIKNAFLQAEIAGLRFLARLSGTQSLDDKLAVVNQRLETLAKYSNADSPLVRENKRELEAQRQKLIDQGAGKVAPVEEPKAKDFKPPNVADTSPHAHTPTDQTDNLNKTAQDAYLQGVKALTDAQAALTTSIEDRATAEKKAVDVDTGKKLADLDQQAIKIGDAKNDANKKSQLALIAQAKIDEEAAGEARKQLIDLKAETAEDQRTLDFKKTINGYYDEIASIAASEATTAAERRKIETKALAARQATDRAELLNRQKQERAGLSDPSQIDGVLSRQRAERAAQDDLFKAQSGKLGFDNASPFEAYMRSLDDLDTQLSGEGVQALQSINDGIVDIIANGGKVKDVLKSIVAQMLADFTRINLQQAEKSLFSSGGGGSGGGNFLSKLGSLFGGGGGGGSLDSTVSSMIASNPNLFAAGTDSAPAGMAIVGERGPELLNLPRGAQVIPNDILRGLTRVSATAAPQSAQAMPDLHFHFSGQVSPSDARRTGRQAAVAFQRHVAGAKRMGY